MAVRLAAVGDSREQERRREWERRDQRQEPQGEAPEAVGHQSVLDLQRAAGNHAVSALLRELAPDHTNDAVAPEVSRDVGAEMEADRIADAAVDRLGNDATSAPLIDGTLSPTLRRALGAVAPNLGAIDGVRVHTDENANAAADSIDARAFTRGQDVSVARGELDNHVEGHRLIAHETVHAARHQPVTGGNLVHAKLRGTKDALVNMGGGETSGKLRKLVKVKTNWDDVVDGVGAYEEMEAAILKSGTNPSAQDLMKVKPKMLKQLARIESACTAWEKANKGESSERRKERHGKFAPTSQETPETEDTRVKAERRQAVAMLLPRVRLEIDDLKSGRWTQSLGLSDKQMTGTGKEKKGQMNPVKELMYATESGEFSGYFKADKGFNAKLQGHEADVGIEQIDPNYGARAVAMYRLDQLLGAEVTARAEFAVHGGKLGTVLQSADGVAGSKSSWASDEEQQEQKGPGSILTSDPVFQRGMNKLQILDAICGQLDRHTGNWFVDADKQTGKVKSVTGIDLDMAFGGAHEDPSKGYGENYRGLPKMIDEEFALKILKVKPSDIRNAIQGLLSKQEVEATVKRFQWVLNKINEIPRDQLVKNWDQSTADKNRELTKTGDSGYKTYASQITGGTVKQAIEDMEEACQDALHGHGPPPFRNAAAARLRDLPNESADAIRAYLKYRVAGANEIKDRIWDMSIPVGKTTALAMELLNETLGDDALMAKVEIGIMELPEGRGAHLLLAKIFEPVIDAVMRKAIVRYKRVSVGAN
jgi:hypothetical protein